MGGKGSTNKCDPAKGGRKYENARHPQIRKMGEFGIWNLELSFRKGEVVYCFLFLKWLRARE